MSFIQHGWVILIPSQVDVQVRVNREMTQKEKNMYTAAVLAESAAKLAQSAASYEEVSSLGVTTTPSGLVPTVGLS